MECYLSQDDISMAMFMIMLTAFSVAGTAALHAKDASCMSGAAAGLACWLRSSSQCFQHGQRPVPRQLPGLDPCRPTISRGPSLLVCLQITNCILHQLCDTEGG